MKWMFTYRHVSFGAQQPAIVLVHLQHAESASIELLVRSEQLYCEALPEAKHTVSGLLKGTIRSKKINRLQTLLALWEIKASSSLVTPPQ